MSSTGIRTTRPANEFKNWYRTVDLRIARPLLSHGTKKISLSAEVFNVFNWDNNLSYDPTQFTAAGVARPTFGTANGAYAARQAQVGMKIDW